MFKIVHYAKFAQRKMLGTLTGTGIIAGSLLLTSPLAYAKVPKASRSSADRPAITAPALAPGAKDTRFLKSPGQEQYPQATTLLLLDNLSYTINADGSCTYVEHNAVKLLDALGLSDYAPMMRKYNSEREDVQVRAARIIEPDGTVTEIAPENIKDDVVLEKAKLYANYRYKAIDFSACQPGSVLEFEIQTTIKPLPQGQFWNATYLQNIFPIERSTYTVEAPENTVLNLQTNVPGLKPQKSRQGERVTYHFATSHQPLLQLAVAMPNPATTVRRINLSSFSTWNDLGKWAASLWDSQLKTSPQFKAKCLTVASMGTSVEKRVQDVAQWLHENKNVHTILPSDGIYHTPDQLIENQELSSVDYLYLTHAMLQELGISPQVYYTSYYMNGELAKVQPSPDNLGSEMLLSVKDENGKTLWLSSAQPGIVFYAPPAKLQHCDALLLPVKYAQTNIALDNARVVTLPSTLAQDNVRSVSLEGRVETLGTMELSAESSSLGMDTVQWKTIAPEAQGDNKRANVAKWNLSELSQEFISKFSTYFSFIQDPAPFCAGDQPVETNATLLFATAAGFDKQNGQFKINMPIYVGTNILYLAELDPNRQLPVVFNFPYTDEIKLHLILPKNANIVALPAEHNINNACGSYSNFVRQKDNEVWFTSRLVLNNDYVEPKDFALLKELSNAQIEVLAQPLTYTLDPTKAEPLKFTDSKSDKDGKGAAEDKSQADPAKKEAKPADPAEKAMPLPSTMPEKYKK